METINKKTVGVIILNYENFNDTLNCIQSVNEYCSEEKPLIIIVDNGSKNDSVDKISSFLIKLGIKHPIINSTDKIEQLEESIVLIKTNKNLGYAKGNNVGIRFLIKQKVEHILILNNDILLTENIITPLVKCLNKNPDIGIISPLLMKDSSNIDYNCCRSNPTYKMLLSESLQFLKMKSFKKVVDQKYFLKENSSLINQELVYCDIVSGACILANRSTWEALNGFDENTFLYYEENILFKKLKRLNLKMALLTDVSAIHLGAKSTKKVQNSKLLRIDLDSLLYYLKNYSKTSRSKIIVIKAIRSFQIYMLNVYNLVKK